MRFKKIIKLFEDQNVCVCGLRGTGKDLLMSNVVIRRKLPYVCNVDYGDEFHPFAYSDIDCGKNTHKNFITGNINEYAYPYPDGTDIYLSDAGIYFPSQFCSELNREYPFMAVFQAISRHVGDCNFHFNVQNLNRVWDKIREQSDIYIMCRGSKYIRGLVFQRITIYDRYESAVNRQRPLRLPMPLLSNKETRMQRRIQLAQYEATHGQIRDAILIYKNKSNYNTRQFKEILEGGKKHD
jgi:hypothetical protein